MIGGKQTLANLRTTFNGRFKEAYAGTPAWADTVATRIPSSSRTQTYGWMVSAIRLREWVGERQAIAMQEHDYVLANVPFEATFEVKRDDILDDELGIYSAVIVPGFAEALRKHPDQSIVERVFQANPVCFDGKDFWATDHPTFAPDGMTQTYSNDFELELGPTLEDAINSISTVRAAMRSIVGENGNVIDTDPLTLIVPPQKEDMAYRIANSEYYPSTTEGAGNQPNIYKGRIKVVVIQELGDDGDTWYLADTSKSLRPFIWQVRSTGVLRSFDSGQDWEAFNKNVYTWGIDGDDGGSYRGNAGVSLPFLCARSTKPES